MIHFSGGFSGRFRIIKTKEDGTVTFDQSCHNVVLKSGIVNLYKSLVGRNNIVVFERVRDWNELVFAKMSRLFLGTGTTEPSLMDTGLESRSGTLGGKLVLDGTKNDSYNRYTYRPDIVDISDKKNKLFGSEATMEFRYGKGEAEGVWTELGLADDTSYNNPFTRALIRDDSGNPISLTVLSDEYLTVFYTIRYQDGMGEPVTQTMTLDGSDHQVSFGPLPDGWKNTVSMWTTTPPLRWFVPHRNSDKRPWGYGGDSPPLSASFSFDEETLTITEHLTFGPSPSDEAIYGFTSMQPGGYSATLGSDSSATQIPLSFGSSSSSFIPYVAYIDPPFQKLADYQVTMEVKIQLEVLGPPVKGVAFTAGSTTLDVAWDAYPSATEYQLVLRQDGVEIDSQTLTTESASFTGLTADTRYHLDIRAITSAMDGSRSIHAASTTA